MLSIYDFWLGYFLTTKMNLSVFWGSWAMKGNYGANTSAWSYIGTLLYWKILNDIDWQACCYFRLSFQEYSAQSVLLLSFALTNSLAYMVLYYARICDLPRGCTDVITIYIDTWLRHNSFHPSRNMCHETLTDTTDATCYLLFICNVHVLPSTSTFQVANFKEDDE